MVQRSSGFAAFYGSDPKIIDRPRVLRLPGTWHQKKAPVQVRVVRMPAPADVRLGDFARYDHATLTEAHPCEFKAPGTYTAPTESREPLCDLDSDDALARADAYLRRRHTPFKMRRQRYSVQGRVPALGHRLIR